MRRIVPFFSLVFLLLGLLFSSMSLSAEEKQNKLHVLSTIKPIQAIVLAIAGEHVDSAQLIPDYASPHHYSFKPSDIRKIKNADVIFRIDEDMEVMLNPTFDKMSQNTPIIALADNPEIELLDSFAKRNPAVKTEHDEAAEKGHTDHDDHNDKHGKKDLHIWTSPQNQQKMAKTITTTLSRLDSANTQNYENNLARFTQDLIKTTQDIEAELASVKTQNFVVFHNSWQYFIKQFGLQQPVIVSMHDGLPTGIKKIQKIRNEIKSRNIRCVFSDPSTKLERVDTLMDGLNINSTKIDVLATELPLSSHASEQLFKQMSQKIKACLTPKLKSK